MARDDLDRIRRERDLFRRLLELGSCDRVEPFLKQALELIVEITQARRGYLEVRDAQASPEGSEDAAWSLGFGCSDVELANIRDHISRGIIGEALATGETVVTDSAMIDERFRARESVQRSRIESVLCAPLGGSGAHGVVYLQGRREGAFSEDDRAAAELFARNLAPLADRLLIRQRSAVDQDATRSLRERHDLGHLVGRSRALASALEPAMLAAPLDVTLLITGPSGTGKTDLARIVHANSRRAAGPFVELNCASLPETLIESELFGARAGSHSEARRDVSGKVAAAEGGTLFLDEVSELPVGAQAKLLQLLQSRQYYALGASTPSVADVRVIAASNADLEQRISERLFREDLYFRLNVLPVRMPGIGERGDDVTDLALALCTRANTRHGLPDVPLAASALRGIAAADWPGNVRQLENALEAAAIRAAGESASEIALRHVFPQVDATERAGNDAGASYQDATRAFQRDLLVRTLSDTGWNIAEAARRLDLARSRVYELISSFGMKRDRGED